MFVKIYQETMANLLQTADQSNAIEKLIDSERNTPAVQSDSELLSLQLLMSVLNEMKGDNVDIAKTAIQDLAREEMKYMIQAAKFLRENEKIRDKMGGFNLANALHLAKTLKSYKQQKEFDDIVHSAFSRYDGIGVDFASGATAKTGQTQGQSNSNNSSSSSSSSAGASTWGSWAKSRN